MSHTHAPAIQAADLAATYQTRPVWSQATFAVDEGEFIAVLGPNGGGKSTLFRVLLGLLEPARGRVEVLGRRPHRGNPAIGYVPQHRSLDPDLLLRGRDLVHLGIDGHQWGFALRSAPENERRVDAAVAAVGAQPLAGRPIGRLSGGEQQRLLLAQALAGDPRLLLLDEPLASLDLRNQIVMSQLIKSVAQRQHLTVLLIAHDINPLLPIVDRVLYIAHGRLAIGTVDELITTEALTRLYDAPVEVLHDSHGHRFVVGLEAESAHPHG